MSGAETARRRVPAPSRRRRSVLPPMRGPLINKAIINKNIIYGDLLVLVIAPEVSANRMAEKKSEKIIELKKKLNRMTEFTGKNCATYTSLGS